MFNSKRMSKLHYLPQCKSALSNPLRCLGHCSIAVRRCHDQDDVYKRKHLTGNLSFRDLDHYYHVVEMVA